MAQHVRVLPILSEDQSLIPNIHTGWFTTSCNSLDLGHLLPSSGLCGKLHSYAYTHMCTHTQKLYIYIIYMYNINMYIYIYLKDSGNNFVCKKQIPGHLLKTEKLCYVDTNWKRIKTLCSHRPQL